MGLDIIAKHQGNLKELSYGMLYVLNENIPIKERWEKADKFNDLFYLIWDDYIDLRLKDEAKYHSLPREIRTHITEVNRYLREFESRVYNDDRNLNYVVCSKEVTDFAIELEGLLQSS